MKTKIEWFVIGFAASWMVWSVVAYVRFRPRNHTQTWSKLDQELAPEWLKQAQGRRFGAFEMYTPANSSDAAAMLLPPKPNPYPQIMITDENQDGQADSVLVCDSQLHHISVQDKDGDGIFDSHSYSTGLSGDSLTYIDNDMDGVADSRMSLSNGVAVRVGSVWYDFEHEEGKPYVVIDGDPKPVEKIDGVFRLVGE